MSSLMTGNDFELADQVASHHGRGSGWMFVAIENDFDLVVGKGIVICAGSSERVVSVETACVAGVRQKVEVRHNPTQNPTLPVNSQMAEYPDMP